MATRVAYSNGRFVPEVQAALSVFDTAITTGEVVVEVTRTFSHRPFRLREHLDRLYHGLEELRIDINLRLGEMVDITHETLAQNLATDRDDVDWQILHVVSRGLNSHFELFRPRDIEPTIIVVCFPLEARIAKMFAKYLAGVDLVVTPQRAIPAEILSPQIKSRGRLDYVLARLQAAQIQSGASGVLLGADGCLTEGTGTTLYLVRQGRLFTPPGHRVLQGITRSVVLLLARRLGIPVVEDVDLLVDDARAAEEMFVTSTIIMLVHARSFDGRMVADGCCGPLTARIRAALVEEIGVDYVEQARRYAERRGVS